ncbi:MAG: histidinol dehydrogenase [Caldilineaceae bacterium]
MSSSIAANRPYEWLRRTGRAAGTTYNAIPRVGIYIPAVKRPIFNSLLMTAIPAKVAGVLELIISPPQRASGLPHPTTVVAADIAGVDTIYVGGGAKPSVRLPMARRASNASTKFVVRESLHYIGKAPGLWHCRHRWPARSHRNLVIADEHTDPQLVAADLLAQAEHDIWPVQFCSHQVSQWRNGYGLQS